MCDNSLQLSFTPYLLYVIKIIAMKIAAGQSTSTLYKDKTNPIFFFFKKAIIHILRALGKISVDTGGLEVLNQYLILA